MTLATYARFGFLALLIAADLAGQPTFQPSGPRPCTYDRCALRLERNVFSNDIRSGRTGDLVDNMGFYNRGLVELLPTPDSAAANAREATSYQGASAVLSVLSALALVGGAAAAGPGYESGNGAVFVGLVGGGLAFSVASGFAERSAFNSLAHAIWWHNRDLPRADGTTSTDGCSYDECALEIHLGFFGQSLVRGRAQTPAARIGLFSNELSAIVQRSDSALRNARAFRKAQLAGAAMLTAGAASIAAVSLVCTQGLCWDAGSKSKPLVIGGVFLIAGSIVPQFIAEHRLARTIWWYNRSLPLQ